MHKDPILSMEDINNFEENDFQILRACYSSGHILRSGGSRFFETVRQGASRTKGWKKALPYFRWLQSRQRWMPHLPVTFHDVVGIFVAGIKLNVWSHALRDNVTANFLSCPKLFRLAHRAYVIRDLKEHGLLEKGSGARRNKALMFQPEYMFPHQSSSHKSLVLVPDRM
ncbi:hypothetical protein HAX54_046748 [Datura stramonium]|uniref:Uncharacterized protein n=1 Tax=Datura stramonium TaxID=4076 RepID=A0ABS8WHH0_DATST|nr:hypothetical protein [Datura stramonium]